METLPNREDCANLEYGGNGAALETPPERKKPRKKKT